MKKVVVINLQKQESLRTFFQQIWERMCYICSTNVVLVITLFIIRVFRFTALHSKKVKMIVSTKYLTDVAVDNYLISKVPH